MTNDGQNLLRAILANPFDLAPRGAYADWLDERGRPEDIDRAAFIRAGLGGAGTDRQMTLRSIWEKYKHGDEWFCRPLARIVRRAYTVPSDGANEVTFWMGWDIDCLSREQPEDKLTVRVRLGFVDELEMPERLFFRHYCRTCLGGGYIDGGRTCPTCRSERVIDDLPARIVKRHPVRSIRLSDKKPAPMYNGKPSWRNGLYFPTKQVWPFIQSVVPVSLFHLIEQPGKKNLLAASFDTEAEAVAALSRACLKYARNRAGLPPLT